MRLTFLGAAGEVTGSCTLLEVGRAKILIDCGMHQGDAQADVRNARDLPFSLSDLTCLVLTHAHIDHSGRLPLLVKRGLKAPIYATPATCELTGVLLEDSANLQVQDAKRESLRNARRGRPGVEPLYLPEHVPPVLSLLRPLDYTKAAQIAPGVTLRMTDAGHILGSASLELSVTQPDGTNSLVVFSGDLGPKGQPLLKDPIPPTTDGRVPDVVVLESTYGDRDHRSLDDTVEELAGVIRESVWDRQKVLIPSFAVGRSQTLLYHLRGLCEHHRCPDFPIYLDSPMAIKATRLYREHRALFDAESRQLARNGEDPMGLSGVTPVESGEESRALNEQRGAMVIIAGSGMCNGGRILHHLRHNLYKPDTRVIIAGYQAYGTLGRRLVEGASEVKIFGEPIVVRARVHTMGGLSAHAGQGELLAWARTYQSSKPPPRFVLNHGEDKPRTALARLLEREMRAKVSCPSWGGSVQID